MIISTTHLIKESTISIWRTEIYFLNIYKQKNHKFYINKWNKSLKINSTNYFKTNKSSKNNYLKIKKTFKIKTKKK